MQVLKEEIKNNIKKAAVQCFKNVGYEKASMRDISKHAGISVGNLYRYFPNKEALFDYIVDPLVKSIEKKMKNPERKMPFLDINLMQENELIENIIQARMTNRDALFILFLRNKGTKYENIKKTLANFIEEQSREFIADEFGNDSKIIEGNLYHKASAAAFVEGFLIILEEASDDRVFMRNLIQFIELNIKTIVRHMYNVRDHKVEFRRINHEEIYKHFNSGHCCASDSSAKDY